MKDMTLVILAAGMGSRFGGLKQIEPVGPNGEFIIDYSVYDAIEAGFNKVVFIIRKENYEIFRDTVGKRIENKVKVLYAFQEMDDVREKYNIPLDRTKPLGTTHAILCVKDLVNEPFLIINSDDFYGKEAYLDAANFLKQTNYKENGAILYKIVNTLTENGKVKRGICYTENNKLVKAIESSIGKIDGKIIAEPLNGEESFEINEDQAISMNMFVLLPSIFPMLEKTFDEFMMNNQNNLDKCEALIIEDLFKLIEENKITLNIVKTNAKWFGVTYKEDKEQVVKSINELIEIGLYPKDLWKDK